MLSDPVPVPVDPASGRVVPGHPDKAALLAAFAQRNKRLGVQPFQLYRLGDQPPAVRLQGHPQAGLVRRQEVV